MGVEKNVQHDKKLKNESISIKYLRHHWENILRCFQSINSLLFHSNLSDVGLQGLLPNLISIYLSIYLTIQLFTILSLLPIPSCTPDLLLPFQPCLREGRECCPMGSPRPSQLYPGLGSCASIQTRGPKCHNIPSKQVPIPLSMASQSAPIVSHRESRLITCSFRPGPAGFGELPLEQAHCLSWWIKPL